MTKQQLEAKIALIDSAIERALNIGQETSNESGGSSRSMKDVDYQTLEKQRSMYQRKLDILNNGGLSVSIGW